LACMQKRGSWDQLFIWITCKICVQRGCKARSKMAASNDKSEVDNCLSASICLCICNLIFQTQQQRAMTLQLNLIATISSFQNYSCLSFQLISVRIPPCCFSDLFPRAISAFKMVGGLVRPFTWSRTILATGLSFQPLYTERGRS